MSGTIHDSDRPSCRRAPVAFRLAPTAGAPLVLAVVLASALSPACAPRQPPERRYYDEHIQPILNAFCVGNTSPCHRIDPVTGTALGNLDLSSFAAVSRRRDVLRTYGPYPQPLLLLKALPEETTLFPYRGGLVPSEIRHVGGKSLAPSSDAFYELKRWLDNGATRDGLSPLPVRRRGQGDCNRALPADTGGLRVDRASAAYRSYVADVEPVLHESCAFATCHGSSQSDFYLTCGESDAERDANFLRAASFVVNAATAPGEAAVEQSEILLRPLDPQAGGMSHTGGVFFPSREDEAWKKLRDFAVKVQATPPAPAPESTGERFFGEHVMPLLIRRGCALEGCHSPDGANDFRLRPGSPGFLSRLALRRNYETALLEFMSLDAVDVRQSRLVKKNLFASRGGIAHRGGALLEGPGPDSAAPCPAAFDAATASAFCTLGEWHRIERASRAGLVSPLQRGQVLPLAFVARPPDTDGPVEFDTFRGGADLRLADAVLGDGGRVERVERARSALPGCAGLAGRTDLDVRGPDWSYDGTRLAFAARAGADAGLDLWMVELPGGACRRLTNDGGRPQGSSGVRVHNFDPAFSPDGGLVFASTRAGTLTLKRLLPGADLYRVPSDLDFDKAERMTFLTNSELAPAFMQSGQVSFTAEKAAPGFYQLSGRRINWDLTDYHPLLAQRAQSVDTFGMTKPSIGYQQATEIRETLDRNFVFILSDASARGAGGALAVFNRSIGPFEEGRGEITFVRALTLPDPAAHGRTGTRGVHRSPAPLPNGEILTSFAAGVSDPATQAPRYDLVAVTETGGRRPLLDGGAQSLVEATLGYKRSSRLLYRNVAQLVFGGRGGTTGDAVVHFPDLPMLSTLLGANLRRGRNVAALDAAAALRVYEARPPPSPVPDPAFLLGVERVFTDRKPLGQAPIEPDRSLKVALPARTALVLELLDKTGAALFTMEEEHQFGPGEHISPGVPRKLFDGVCGGCHGSVSGQELDVAVTADALTGASVSASRDQAPKTLR